ncbi:mechanosensitive ion channel [Candidatus Woesearchaeota archaeon]|nr:mechanosensitive ion channel [Candidatus Woesearchaeota archaeon]
MVSIIELWSHFQEKVSDWLLKLVVSVVILLIGFILARMCRKMVFKVLHELELNKLLRRLAQVNARSEEFLSRSAAYLIYAITFLLALNQLGITATVLYLLLGAILLVLVVSFLLGIKDFIPNAFAGLKLSKQGLFREGDVVEIGKIKGKVIKLTLLETRLITKHQDIIVIPNATVVKEIVRMPKQPQVS